jgi:uncharacterized protein
VVLTASAALSVVAGLTLAVITAPVGVSGAVFLLPIQLSVLAVPSPAVTPTNLLFNVVSIPGALFRYGHRGSLRSPLTTLLLAGTLPGVIIGAVIRVLALPGVQAFKLFVAVLLLPLGVWLMLRPVRHVDDGDNRQPPSTRTILVLSLVVGVIGGIYGVGGGSLLSPILVERGLRIAAVAPAALTSTFLTSIVGVITYVVLALTTTTGSDIAPQWAIGILCGVGGLVGGFIGAHLQPRLPEKALQLVLGALAVVTATVYAVQALT